MANSGRFKKLLFSAALFNWIAASALCFAYQPLFQIGGITPLPTHPLFLQLFAVLAFLFGVGYYWASRDLERNRNIIILGTLGKLLVFLFPLGYWLAGSISWKLLILVSVDLVYALLFIHILTTGTTSNEARFQ